MVLSHVEYNTKMTQWLLQTKPFERGGIKGMVLVLFFEVMSGRRRK